MDYKSGEAFLNRLYQNMHQERFVMKTAKKGDNPDEKIRRYLERLEKAHKKAMESPHNLDLLKHFYYEKYVIKELPASYIESVRLRAREEGRFDLLQPVSKLLKQVQEDQKKSLDRWLDYFISEDEVYPTWFKYYAFQGMLRMNKMNKEKKSFGKRSRNTTEFYIELNQEALAQAYTAISKMIEKKELTKEEEKALNDGKSFERIYSYYLAKMGVYEKKIETDGIWKKYDWGSNPYALWKSLQGKYTGWCTAGEETAREQLRKGDFYIYYTMDQKKEYTDPRIAIRMDGEEIAEVRGIAVSQELEESMIPIAEEKLKEFKDYKKYQQKLSDMKELTKIEKKQKEGLDLSKEELEFLYEIHHKIKGFGYKEDPRVKELREKRDPKHDFSIIFSCQEDDVVSSIEALKKGNAVVYLGDLRVSKVEEKENLRKIKMVTGLLDATNEKELSYFSSLVAVGESLWAKDMILSKGLENLETINGNFYCNSLRNGKGLKHLKSVGSYIYAPYYSEEYMEDTLFLEKLKEDRSYEIQEEVVESKKSR